jgi:hypothetical protein
MEDHTGCTCDLYRLAINDNLDPLIHANKLALVEPTLGPGVVTFTHHAPPTWIVPFWMPIIKLMKMLMNLILTNVTNS